MIILDKRLKTAADLVPDGAALADIGSDHALLPIYLALEGRVVRALASDINDGPVAAAKKNMLSNGVEDIVKAQKADGLCGVEDFSPDCITILGMGGELIVKIIDRAEWVRDKKITLILQPMTHAEILSKYLCENGFCIHDDVILRESERDDRIYRIMVAGYDGQRRELSEAEHYVGVKNLQAPSEATVTYIQRIINMLNTKVQGRTLGGLDCAYENRLIEELQKYTS